MRAGAYMLKKLSVVTIAKNEEVNISACINSAKGWADEHELDKSVILW